MRRSIKILGNWRGETKLYQNSKHGYLGTDYVNDVR